MMTVCLISTQSRAGLVALVAELWVMVWFIRSTSAKIVAALATVFAIAAVVIVFNAEFHSYSRSRLPISRPRFLSKRVLPL